MSFDITGKTALVTGGARDIGRAICLELARNGADVVVNYRASSAEAQATVREIENLGRRALAVQADVTKKADVDRLVAAALDFGGGGVDILVNNAGGIVRRALLGELTELLIDEVLRLNFTSVLLLCQAVIPHMVSSIYRRSPATTAAHPRLPTTVRRKLPSPTWRELSRRSSRARASR
jgi:3-oxoacyl-[acyl-carrier protein] reductase